MKDQLPAKGPFRKPSLLRSLAVIALLLPLSAAAVVHHVAVPDLETWLAAVTNGFFRRDAFENLNGVAFAFTCVLAMASFVAILSIIWHRSQYLVPLAAGPLFCGLLYVVVHGFADPAWFTLFALLTIGMFVSTLVTIEWAVAVYVRRGPNKS